jgi:hypothetical protein
VGRGQRLCILYRPDSYPAKMTTNFRPNFKHDNGNCIFFTSMAAKVGVLLRSLNALNPQMFETDPALSPFPQQSTLVRTEVIFRLV